MFTKEEAYSKVADLVERFSFQIDSYKKSDYNETLTRLDFINPFFKALGWDVDNSQGNAEAYREVIHEDKLRIGSATKAPDYSFRLPGGKRLFFVEAKKPSVYVREEILPAYQVRRYGWSAKLPVSLITDFEEFAVYDCTKKPDPADKASTARIKYFNYKQYLDEFDFIWNTFSKSSVLKGSFDKFIVSDTYKKGTATVDKEFLASLDAWRILLAQNIALRNVNLTEEELNFVVQQTLDRIIFLRIAEDRGVEDYGELQQVLTKSKEEGAYYKGLFNLFKEADSKYNSGLFDFKKDTLSANVSIDNKVIKTIISELYYPVSPYEFSVLGVEILGSAYEQFLGKQIKLSAGHKAIIEEKPEVRKAGGVYYTPQYIVDYIVKNTVGKLTEGKTPEQVAALNIVDPACGSGSFLIGAFKYLLNWHLDYYKPEFISLSETAVDTNSNIKTREAAIKQRNKLPLTPEGHLTTALKKQILLNNIYGVDIDTQAVEVTKLSLLLKCMEGETGSSINAQMRFGERVLPTLDDNIKSGNSLIDVDFYDTEFDFGEEKKIKPFNWQQAFPKVFDSSLRGTKQSDDVTTGFDAVIGNPPYFSLDNTDDTSKNYLQTKFASFATRQSNIYFFFIALGSYIIKEDGLLSFINERYYFNSKNATNFRKFVLENFCIQHIVDFRNIQIFESVNTLTVINTFSKSKNCKSVDIIQFNQEVRKLAENKILNVDLFERITIPQKDIPYQNWTFTNEYLTKLKSKLSLLTSLDQLVFMGQGLKSGLNEVFIVDEAIIQEFNLEKKLLKKYVKTKDIQKFQIHFRDLYLILALNETQIEKYPNTKRYLLNFKTELENRYQFKDGVCKWYSLSIPQNINLFKNYEEKIFTPLYSKGNKFGYANNKDGEEFYALTDTFILTNKKEISLKYLVGILNSKLINFYNEKFGKLKRDGYYEYSRNTLAGIPIKEIKSNSDKTFHDNIVHLVETMLQLNKEKQQTTLSDKLEQLNTRIKYIDDKINKLVYQLYELSEEEIKIIEEK